LHLKVDLSKVDIQYLISELNSEIVMENITSLRIGEIQSIRKEDFLSIEIEMLSLEEQRAKMKGLVVAYAEQKRRELLSFNRIHGLEKEIFEQNSFLRHTLAGPVSNLQYSFARIIQILNEQILPQVPDALSLKAEGGQVLNLDKHIDIVSRDIKKLYNAVKRQTSTESRFDRNSMTQIDIKDFFSNYVAVLKDNKDLKFEIDLMFDEGSFSDPGSEYEIKSIILGSPDLLTDMLNNLLENAINHAFLDGYTWRIEILLMKNEAMIIGNSEKPTPGVTILFSNTGAPCTQRF
jgi:type I restriction enzyme M protein